MLRRAALAGALILSASCRSEGGDAVAGAVATRAGSGKPSGSGNSFSADLARELGAGSATRPDGAGGKPTGEPAAAGSAPGAGPASGGGSDAKAGDAKAGDMKAGDMKAGSAMSASASGDPTKSAAAMKPGAARDTNAGAAWTDVKIVANAGAPAAEPRLAPPVSAPVSHGPIKVPADLAAIKLSLLPNWDRDVDEAGTFRYVVRIKGTQSTKTFTFRYGYDDAKAPVDRDQYKKYLQDSRALTGEIKDRQRGAAWFLEGSDAQGTPAFRYVVLYGGKRLICYGSLYKDAESNRLGDDRDQTLIQAKQICETLAL